MVLTTQKLLWLTFVIILAFPIEARRLSTYGEKISSNLVQVENGKRALFERDGFGMLAKGPVPSSPPNKALYVFVPSKFEDIDFEKPIDPVMPPQNLPVLPSGLSPGMSDPPFDLIPIRD